MPGILSLAEMAERGDSIVTVVTCEGDISDPDFPYRLGALVARLKRILTAGDKPFHVTNVEPWNSVRVTFTIPQEAARRLRQLAQDGDRVLRDLGILSVQIEGDQVISLTIAANGNLAEPQEIVLRADNDSRGSASTPSFDLSGSEGSPGPSNVDATRKNVVAQYLGQQAAVTAGALASGASTTSSVAHVATPTLPAPPQIPSSAVAGTIQTQFKSPNVVAPGSDPIPFPARAAPPVRTAGSFGPFPFASMTHAMNTMQSQTHHQSSPTASSTVSRFPFASPPPPPYPEHSTVTVQTGGGMKSSPGTPSPTPSPLTSTAPSPAPVINNVPRTPTAERSNAAALSSPLLVNLLQSDVPSSGSTLPTKPGQTTAEHVNAAAKRKRKPRKSKDGTSLSPPAACTVVEHGCLSAPTFNVTMPHLGGVALSPPPLSPASLSPPNAPSGHHGPSPGSTTVFVHHPRSILHHNPLPSPPLTAPSSTGNNSGQSSQEPELSPWPSPAKRTQHLVNPFTGQLEPMMSDESLGSPPPPSLPPPNPPSASCDKSPGTTPPSSSSAGSRPPSDPAEQSSCAGNTNNSSSSSGGSPGEKIKLRLKLDTKPKDKDSVCSSKERADLLAATPPLQYKVDVSFVNVPVVGARRASVPSGNGPQQVHHQAAATLQSSSSTPNISCAMSPGAGGTTGATSPVTEPRVPPLHISLRGRNATVMVVSPRKSSRGNSPRSEDDLMDARSPRLRGQKTSKGGGGGGVGASSSSSSSTSSSSSSSSCSDSPGRSGATTSRKGHPASSSPDRCVSPLPPPSSSTSVQQQQQQQAEVVGAPCRKKREKSLLSGGGILVVPQTDPGSLSPTSSSNSSSSSSTSSSSSCSSVPAPPSLQIHRVVQQQAGSDSKALPVVGNVHIPGVRSPANSSPPLCQSSSPSSSSSMCSSSFNASSSSPSSPGVRQPPVPQKPPLASEKSSPPPPPDAQQQQVGQLELEEEEEEVEERKAQVLPRPNDPEHALVADVHVSLAKVPPEQAQPTPPTPVDQVIFHEACTVDNVEQVTRSEEDAAAKTDAEGLCRPLDDHRLTPCEETARVTEVSDDRHLLAVVSNPSGSASALPPPETPAVAATTCKDPADISVLSQTPPRPECWDVVEAEPRQQLAQDEKVLVEEPLPVVDPASLSATANVQTLAKLVECRLSARAPATVIQVPSVGPKLRQRERVHVGRLLAAAAAEDDDDDLAIAAPAGGGIGGGPLRLAALVRAAMAPAAVASSPASASPSGSSPDSAQVNSTGEESGGDPSSRSSSGERIPTRSSAYEDSGVESMDALSDKQSGYDNVTPGGVEVERSDADADTYVQETVPLVALSEDVTALEDGGDGEVRCEAAVAATSCGDAAMRTSSESRSVAEDNNREDVVVTVNPSGNEEGEKNTTVSEEDRCPGDFTEGERLVEEVRRDKVSVTKSEDVCEEPKDDCGMDRVGNVALVEVDVGQDLESTLTEEVLQRRGVAVVVPDGVEESGTNGPACEKDGEPPNENHVRAESQSPTRGEDGSSTADEMVDCHENGPSLGPPNFRSDSLTFSRSVSVAVNDEEEQDENPSAAAAAAITMTRTLTTVVVTRRDLDEGGIITRNGPPTLDRLSSRSTSRDSCASNSLSEPQTPSPPALVLPSSPVGDNRSNSASPKIKRCGGTSPDLDAVQLSADEALTCESVTAGDHNYIFRASKSREREPADRKDSLPAIDIGAEVEEESLRRSTRSTRYNSRLVVSPCPGRGKRTPTPTIGANSTDCPGWVPDGAAVDGGGVGGVHGASEVTSLFVDLPKEDGDVSLPARISKRKHSDADGDSQGRRGSTTTLETDGEPEDDVALGDDGVQRWGEVHHQNQQRSKSPSHAPPASIDFYSKPLKRKCSENAAELIKACMGVEDSPKRTSSTKQNAVVVAAEVTARACASRNMKYKKEDGVRLKGVGGSEDSSDDEVTLSELATKSKTSRPPRDERGVVGRNVKVRHVGRKDDGKCATANHKDASGASNANANVGLGGRKDDRLLGTSQRSARQTDRSHRTPPRGTNRGKTREVDKPSQSGHMRVEEHAESAGKRKTRSSVITGCNDTLPQKRRRYSRDNR